MIFRAQREKMERCLAMAKSITSAKPQLSILTNVLLESKDDRIIVMASDLEVGLYSSFPATIEQEGSTTINVSKLLGAIAQLPNEEIHAEVNQNNDFKIRSANTKIRAQYILKGLGRENFPPFPNIDPAYPRFEMAQSTLKEMIKKTIFSISTEASRQNLNGVFFETQPDTAMLRLTATDGRRLARIERPGIFPTPVEMRMIVPQKVLTELTHSLADEGLVTITFSDSQVFFMFNDLIYASNVIASEFPNCNQVIPKKQDKSLKVEREAFTSALNRSSLLTDEKQNNQVRFLFSPEHAVISVNNADAGSYRDEINIEYEGEEIEIAFNVKYLKDYLKELTADTLKIELSTSLSPATLLVEDDGNYISVIMPMKLNA